MLDGINMSARAGVHLLWIVLFVVTLTSPLKADHNKMLQREYRAGISRHVASDSQGYCYLLVPSTQDGRGFTLKASRNPHPRPFANEQWT